MAHSLPPRDSLHDAGFPVEQLTREEVVAAYFGVGLHWGSLISQNAKGHIVSAPPPPPLIYCGL
jgi:hypothetical protein